METITNIKQDLHLIERYLEEELETGHTAKRLERLLAYVQKQAKNISFQPPVSKPEGKFCKCGNTGYWQMNDGKRYCNNDDCRLPKQKCLLTTGIDARYF